MPNHPKHHTRKHKNRTRLEDFFDEEVMTDPSVQPSDAIDSELAAALLEQKTDGIKILELEELFDFHKIKREAKREGAAAQQKMLARKMEELQVERRGARTDLQEEEFIEFQALQAQQKAGMKAVQRRAEIDAISAELVQQAMHNAAVKIQERNEIRRNVFGQWRQATENAKAEREAEFNRARMAETKLRTQVQLERHAIAATAEKQKLTFFGVRKPAQSRGTQTTTLMNGRFDGRKSKAISTDHNDTSVAVNASAGVIATQTDPVKMPNTTRLLWEPKQRTATDRSKPKTSHVDPAPPEFGSETQANFTVIEKPKSPLRAASMLQQKPVEPAKTPEETSIFWKMLGYK